jgi:hypothetical protein
MEKPFGYPASVSRLGGREIVRKALVEIPGLRPFTSEYAPRGQAHVVSLCGFTIRDKVMCLVEPFK